MEYKVDTSIFHAVPWVKEIDGSRIKQALLSVEYGGVVELVQVVAEMVGGTFFWVSVPHFGSITVGDGSHYFSMERTDGRAFIAALVLSAIVNDFLMEGDHNGKTQGFSKEEVG